MTAGTEIIKRDDSLAAPIKPAWLWAAVGIYLLLLLNGDRLLGDSDTFWQIATGQWILDHRNWPHSDIYSFTRHGAPWISSSWLAQVSFALAYRFGGWAGVIILAAASAALSVGLLAMVLSRRLPSLYSAAIAVISFALAAPHILARPHLLALPVMMLWTIGLLSATEKHRAPSFWLLPIMTLWANLHGGFVFAFVLIAAFAFETWWTTDKPARSHLLLLWTLFFVGALAACCVTPYGWNAFLGSAKILSLGDLLHIISESAPADLSHISLLIVVLLGGLAALLYTGFTLSLPRALMVTGLLYMALAHVRSIEHFAFLTPLIVASPLARFFKLKPDTGNTQLRAAPFAICVTLMALATAVSVYGKKYMPLPINGRQPPSMHFSAKARNVPSTIFLSADT